MLFPTFPLTHSLMIQHHVHRWKLRVIHLQRPSQVSLLVSRSLPRCCPSPSSGPIPPGVRASAFKLMMLEIQNEYIYPWESTFPHLVSYRLSHRSNTSRDRHRLQKAVETAEALKLVGISIVQVPAMWHWAGYFTCSWKACEVMTDTTWKTWCGR